MKILHKVVAMLSELIMEVGERINRKVGKHKEHMSEMLHFKKSMNRIFEVVNMKSFKIEIAIEGAFKKLMDGVEVSRSLAEFTDFTIK